MKEQALRLWMLACRAPVSQAVQDAPGHHLVHPWGRSTSHSQLLVQEAEAGSRDGAAELSFGVRVPSGTT